MAFDAARVVVEVVALSIGTVVALESVDVATAAIPVASAVDEVLLDDVAVGAVVVAAAPDVASITAVVSVAPDAAAIPLASAVDELVLDDVAVAAGLDLTVPDVDVDVVEPVPLDVLDEAGLSDERAGRGLAEPTVRWPTVEPEALAESFVELDFGPESDEPPSVDAAATPCPAPTASPSPTAAARNPLRAARRPSWVGFFRWRACFRWRAVRLLELTDPTPLEGM